MSHQPRLREPITLLRAAREVSRREAPGSSAARVRDDIPQDVLELVPSPVMVVDGDGCALFANRAHEVEFGPLPAGATCCAVAGCGTQADGAAQGCLTQLLRRDERPAIAPTLTRSPDGRAQWVSATPLRPDGDLVVFRIRRAEPGEDEDVRWSTSARLRIHALGPLGVRTAEGPVVDREWLGQRPGRLLKLLVVNRGRPIVADEIAEALWPRGARHDTGAVRHAVHLLRRRLEPDRPVGAPSRFLLTTNRRYALNLDEVWIDADAFETAVRTGLQAFVTGDTDLATRSLQRSLSLYRDDFLADDAYEEWALDERERLRSLLEVPLRVLAELRLREGDCDGAAQFIERLSRIEPFDADVHRLLVEVWLRLGRRTRALRHFELFSARLMRDFGVRPDFDVRSCQRRLGEPLHAL